MVEYEIYQADAFASEVFRGNPAAVVPLQEWLPDATLQAIALENNLSETAYVIRTGEGRYDLRWFTPGAEVELCGHATLATAHILYTELGESASRLFFETRSGQLDVTREDNSYVMDFPAYLDHAPAPQFRQAVTEALGAEPVELVEGAFLLAVFETAETVRNMAPDMSLISKLRPAKDHQGCLLVTAPGDQGYDFVSRFFAPGLGIPEDPVTGSAHCMTAPCWAAKTGQPELRAWQASPRGGEVNCRVEGDRVFLKGQAVTYLRGRISL